MRERSNNLPVGILAEILMARSVKDIYAEMIVIEGHYSCTMRLKQRIFVDKSLLVSWKATQCHIGAS
jgi:hypothetical protein